MVDDKRGLKIIPASPLTPRDRAATFAFTGDKKPKGQEEKGDQLKLTGAKFYIPKDLHKEVHIQARREERSASALVEEFLVEGMRRRKADAAEARKRLKKLEERD